MAVHISYTFRFEVGRTEHFSLAFDEQRMDIIARDLPAPAAWTALEFCRCEHCPLNTTTHQQCPPAHHLQDIVTRLGQELSYTTVTLEVTTSQRTILTQTTMSQAFASLMGLLMATTGCPYTHFFKPMANLHLPLASEKETTFRAISSYLFGQYIAGNPVTDLKGLEKIYQNMEKVNDGFSKRLRASGELKEINSLVQLDMHAKNLSLFLSEAIDELSPLYEGFLKQAKK